MTLLRFTRDLWQQMINMGWEPDEDRVEDEVEQMRRNIDDNLRQEAERYSRNKPPEEDEDGYYYYDDEDEDCDDGQDNGEQHRQQRQQQQQQQKQKGEPPKSEQDEAYRNLSEREKLKLLKKLYRKLVTRLHPDLHPEQTRWEYEMFLKVQEAYEAKDYAKMKRLEAELDMGVPEEVVVEETVEEWETRVKQLMELIEQLRDEISRLENSFPFTYRDKLNDEKWIEAKRAEIEAEIAQLDKEKDELLKIVEELQREAHEQGID